MTHDEFTQRLDHTWKSKTHKVDWLQLEDHLVDILEASLPDGVKLALIRETIDAHTKRGHFQHWPYR